MDFQDWQAEINRLFWNIHVHFPFGLEIATNFDIGKSNGIINALNNQLFIFLVENSVYVM